MAYDSAKRDRHSIRLSGFDYRQAGAYVVTIVTQDRAGLLGEIEEGRVILNDAGRMVQTIWNELPDHYPGVMTDEFVVMPNHVHGIIILAGGSAPLGRPGPGPSERATDNPDGGALQDATRPGPGQAQGPAPTMPANTPVETLTANRQVGAARRGCPGPGPSKRAADSADGAALRDAAGPGTGQAQGPGPTVVLSLPDVVHRFKTLTTKLYTDGVKGAGWPEFGGRLWQRNYYEHIVRNDVDLDRCRRYIIENPLRWALDSNNPLTER